MSNSDKVEFNEKLLKSEPYVGKSPFPVRESSDFEFYRYARRIVQTNDTESAKLLLDNMPFWWNEQMG